MSGNQDQYASIEQILRAFSISDEEWALFHARTQLRHVEDGAFLLRAGEPVKDVYFCNQGLFRLFYTLADGREFTKSFSLASEFVTSYGAMISGGESYFAVQALEDSVVIQIPYSLLQELTDRSHAWERLMRRCAEQLYMKKEERERELLYLSATERLLAFRRKYPGLEARIPQYQIASYLGINPVSLSRIVKQMKV